MEHTSSLIDFYKHFSDEQSCIDYLVQERWSEADEVTCPRCGTIDAKLYKLANGKLKCASCRQAFSVRVGTIFEDSKLPLQKWFLAIYLSTSLKKGISFIQLGKYLDITQKSAWFMLSRIRVVFEYGGGQLEGTVEVDEAYIGGKEIFKHADKRTKGTQGFGSRKTKTPVVGAIEREGQVRATVTTDTGSNTLMTLIRDQISIDATIYTDEHMPYRTLPKLGYKHGRVNHGEKQWAKGDVTTNHMEAYWSHLKRGIDGIYHHVSAKHLQKYCDEYSFRYNTRELNDGERFDVWLGMIERKRLMYTTLTR